MCFCRSERHHAFFVFMSGVDMGYRLQSTQQRTIWPWLGTSRNISTGADAQKTELKIQRWAIWALRSACHSFGWNTGKGNRSSWRNANTFKNKWENHWWWSRHSNLRQTQKKNHTRLGSRVGCRHKQLTPQVVIVEIHCPKHKRTKSGWSGVIPVHFHEFR